MNPESLKKRVDELVDTSIIPTLTDFINIPNLSRNFDAEFFTNGLSEKANQMYLDWGKAQGIKGLSRLEMIEEKGRTPLLFGIVDATPGVTNTILMYGHNDKQPHLFHEWKEGLHPFKAKIQDGLLYGRGGADDGYAFPTSISMIKILQENNIPHPKFILFFENDEESGSNDIMYHLEKFSAEIGTPNLIVCLDSSCYDWDNMFVCQTLRGGAKFKLKVQTMNTSMHSGVGSGLVPDVFRVFRDLLDNIEDKKTGRVSQELFGNMPSALYCAVEKTAQLVGKNVFDVASLVDGMSYTTSDPVEAYKNKTVRPQLTVVGIDNIPSTANGGNVLRSEMTASLSLRMPPWMSREFYMEKVEELLTTNVPYGAKATVEWVSCNPGFYAIPFPKNQEDMLNTATKEVFDGDFVYCHSGGSIPFMGKLTKKFPSTNFIVTGLLGPGSNAHCGNECLNISFLKKLLYVMTKWMALGGAESWD